MTWDWGFTWEILPDLGRALLVTLQASILASIIALVAGLAVAVVRYLRVPLLSPVLSAFVIFIRGTPLLVQLYFLFFVLPVWGLSLSPLVTGVVGLGLHFTAYTAEVYRAGIASVPRGQWDAVTALGLPATVAWRTVIGPQAVRPVVPALGNYVILMFKESVLLSTITVAELLHEAMAIGSDTYRYLEPITLVGLLFWMVSYPTARLIRRWEKRLDRKYG